MLITEGSAKIEIAGKLEKISRELPVFYNPAMAFNRSLTVLLLNSLNKEEMRILDLLAGSGIRSLRFLLELEKKKLKEIIINDGKKGFRRVMKKNLRLNKIKLNKKIVLQEQEANRFLVSAEGYDYIEIDPFGSPNEFLNNTIKHLAREGVLGVTATDTAPLAGKYPAACQRNYWAKPLRGELQHELGLRILIRKVQLMGAQFDKALTPIFSFYKDHYYRVFFFCEKGKQKADGVMLEHEYFLYCPTCLNRKVSFFNKEKCSCGKEFVFAGPLWIGQLFDKVLAGEMCRKNTYPELQKFLEIAEKEAEVKTVGFYCMHVLAGNLKKDIPKKEIIMAKLKKQKINFSETIFSPTGIRAAAEIETIKKLLNDY